MLNETIDLEGGELSAEDIFGADDLTLVRVTVPEWQKNGRPGVVYFRPMSAESMLRFQEQMRRGDKAGFVKIVAECACSSKGEPLFTAAHVEALKKKNVAVFMRLQDMLLQLNGMKTPTKTWDTVQNILTAAGVEASVIAQVRAKWDADDEAVAKNA